MLLDHYLQQYSTMKLTKMESKVRNSLRLGLYQMLFLTKIPVSAAVSESVALTKKLCKNPRAGGMVNGILRNLARHLDDLPTLDRSHPTAYLSLLYSHPPVAGGGLGEPPGRGGAGGPPPVGQQ